MSVPTPPEVAEAAIVEEVARAMHAVAHRSCTFPGCTFEGSDPDEYRLSAAAAVAAYRAQDGGEGYHVELGGQRFTQAQWEAMLVWRTSTDMPSDDAATWSSPTQDGGAEEAVRGADLIAAERQRQIEAEGWTPEHDAEHASDDLARAAACYALPVGARPILPTGKPRPPRGWPWREQDWKPTPDDRVRELVKAGALIAAEIDRLAALAPQDER